MGTRENGFPCLSKQEFETEKERSKLFFLCSYAALSKMSERAGDGYGYALFGNNGCLLRLYGGEAFQTFCAQRGITGGTLWDEAMIGPNAVALGLQQKRPTFLSNTAQTSPALADVAVYFAPVYLDAETIRNEFYDVTTGNLCMGISEEDEDVLRVGIYGGIAIISSREAATPLFLTLIEASAREIALQLYWFNVSYRDPSSDIGYISIDQSRGKNQIMAISSNIYDILGLPNQSYRLHTVEEILDPLPQNKELWDIINGRKIVVDYDLKLTVQNRTIEVSVSTRRSIESRFHMREIVVYIHSLQKLTKMLTKYSGNTARFTFQSIVGQSESYTEVLQRAQTAAQSNSNVLLLGESGAGKDVIAQAIHNASPRKNQPFIVINCAAFSKELIASELFGYESGAFTGAKKGGSIGKFELANHGTLFLDEIGDMPLDLQANLLRAIEQKRFMKVGGIEEIGVDVRIIAATNINLREKIKHRLFRQDLYYRLGVVRLKLPPLRERREDILLLADYFLQSLCVRFNRPGTFLSEDAKEFLLSYHWPGNVRELQNLLEGIISIYNVPIIDKRQIARYLEYNPMADPTPELMPRLTDELVPELWDEAPAAGTARHLTLRPSQVGKDVLLRAMEDNRYNLTKTAQALGISRRTLYRRLEEYDLMR